MYSGIPSALKSIAKLAIPALIIGYLLIYHVSPENWQQLANQPKNYGLLTAALLVATLAILLSFVRWCILVRCQGIDFTMLEAIRIGSICCLLGFVSAGSVGGDLFKAVFLARRRPGKRVAAVASVLVDRGTGLYALVLLVSIALLLTDPKGTDAGEIGLTQIKWVTGILIVSGTASLMLLILGGFWVDRWIRTVSKWRLVGPLIAHIGPPLRMFHSQAPALIASIVMSLGVHGMLSISFYLIAKALYTDPPTLAEHFVIVPIGVLISALPITPAGIGLFEAAVESLYRIIPAQPTLASGTLVALIFELVKIIIAILGTIFYWTANEEVRQSLDQTEQEPSPDSQDSESSE